jgi:hypothetical protein
MKMTSRILTAALISLLQTTASAQFKNVPPGSGDAMATAQAIEGPLELASGGIAIRGVARPADNCPACDVRLLSVEALTNETATITVQNDTCSASYSAESSIVRDAAVLVDSESDEVLRNVNLLGNMTSQDRSVLAAIAAAKRPRDYWRVELSGPLVGTRSGEALLALDLMLSDPQFYSGFALDRQADTVGGAVAQDERAEDARKAVEMYEAATRQMRRGYTGYNWSDQDADFRFTVSCDSGELGLTGRPGFTFLRRSEELEEWSSYFNANYTVIEDLNPQVFAYSVSFSRVAAFFRFVRDNDRASWQRVMAMSTDLPESTGRTPRLIER